MTQNNQSQKGIAALFTVIIISATSLIMALTASFLGLGEMNLGYTSQKSSEALSIADAGIEESLRRFRLDQNYSGGTLEVGEGTCIVNVQSNGNQKTVTSEGIIGNFHKKIQSQITVQGPNITINSWQEITN